MNFMNMAALMGANGVGGVGASMGMPNVAPGGNSGSSADSLIRMAPGMSSTVTPRRNDAASSIAGSSMAGLIAPRSNFLFSG